jgi:hypothetical protein
MSCSLVILAQPESSYLSFLFVIPEGNLLLFFDLALAFVPEIGPGFSLGIQPRHRIGVLTPGNALALVFSDP